VLENEALVKKTYLKQIFEKYIEKDIRDIGKINEVQKFNNFVELLAEQSGNLLNVSEVSSVLGIAMNTINNRLELLEDTFVIQLVKPFSTTIRGEITKMQKVFFIDNGLRNFINDNYEITGNGFENSFFAYINNAYKAKDINYYRTKDKQEIDFVLDKRPFELKLSYTGKNLTALNTFQERYDQK
jgi:predicted AAA+ superfamily ATPase